MDEKEFDYEEYRNNLEKAVEIHDKFYRLRNITIYFILYSVLYSFVIKALITNGLTMFLSLVSVYLISKFMTYLFDEIRFTIRILRKNHKKKKEKIIDEQEDKRFINIIRNRRVDNSSNKNNS